MSAVPVLPWPKRSGLVAWLRSGNQAREKAQGLSR
jgi:hypothetical protein